MRLTLHHDGSQMYLHPGLIAEQQTLRGPILRIYSNEHPYDEDPHEGAEASSDGSTRRRMTGNYTMMEYEAGKLVVTLDVCCLEGRP